ncbi:hypothetical protein HY989_02810 [Candidatus Micrarchaeota archaeon]|nr:hypothetical protein [Candidatus Micrarchaeota archaeon]
MPSVKIDKNSVHLPGEKNAITPLEKKMLQLILLIIFVIILIFGAIWILRSSPMPSSYNPKSYCLASLSNTHDCYDIKDGMWNSSGCGENGCLASDYMVELKCLTNPELLIGTPWYKDNTHFNCGPRPG